MGALVIVVLCVVCLCGESRKIGEGVWGGAHEDRWGVAFELFEVAVVGIGVSFASIRHEHDLGELPKARKRYRSLMYQWKGRRKVAGMKERKKLVGEQHRWWYSTVDADNVIVQISLRENNIVEICRR